MSSDRPALSFSSFSYRTTDRSSGNSSGPSAVNGEIEAKYTNVFFSVRCTWATSVARHRARASAVQQQRIRFEHQRIFHRIDATRREVRWRIKRPQRRTGKSLEDVTERETRVSLRIESPFNGHCTIIRSSVPKLVMFLCIHFWIFPWTIYRWFLRDFLLIHVI